MRGLDLETSVPYTEPRGIHGRDRAGKNKFECERSDNSFSRDRSSRAKFADHPRQTVMTRSAPTENWKWPRVIYLVRHGQSAGNVARDYAEANRLKQIELEARDMDVPLSDLGVAQATALGDWLRALPPDQQPSRLTYAQWKQRRSQQIAAGKQKKN